jgi:hypothetical protein
VISLVDDLRAIQNHTADPSQPDLTWLGSDDARLQADIGAAQRLQPAPDPTMRTAWTAVLAQAGVTYRTLRAAATNLDPATVALAHQQSTVAGDGLLRMGQVLSPTT